ncbi:hypothetical protein [Senegalia massiliensis]|uniref:hypothetical protein n=1 Tax=Senegalia massiliensis TaxID=1720316 RepID=UPI0013EF2F5E|nr:hypothetical protein [Senegalia massiliensis]
MLEYELLTVVQAIPYSTFKERIRFTKNNLKYVDRISFDKNFIYIEKTIKN